MDYKTPEKSDEQILQAGRAFFKIRDEQNGKELLRAYEVGSRGKMGPGHEKENSAVYIVNKYERDGDIAKTVTIFGATAVGESGEKDVVYAELPVDERQLNMLDNCKLKASDLNKMLTEDRGWMTGKVFYGKIMDNAEGCSYVPQSGEKCDKVIAGNLEVASDMIEGALLLHKQLNEAQNANIETDANLDK